MILIKSNDGGNHVHYKDHVNGLGVIKEVLLVTIYLSVSYVKLLNGKVNKMFIRSIRSFLVYILLLVVFLVSCKEKTTNNNEKSVESEIILPVMPLEQQAYLFENVELIDYIFHELPFSLSQSEIPSIQSKIAGIGREPVTETNCNAMGRMFFQVGGEIVIEADLFFSPPNCQHYIFYEEGKAVYANKMAPSNVQFYSQFLNQMNVTQ